MSGDVALCTLSGHDWWQPEGPFTAAVCRRCGIPRSLAERYGDIEDSAARLRSLAAIYEQPLNRDKTFTGSEVASMLRDGKG